MCVCVDAGYEIPSGCWRRRCRLLTILTHCSHNGGLPFYMAANSQQTKRICYQAAAHFNCKYLIQNNWKNMQRSVTTDRTTENVNAKNTNNVCSIYIDSY